MVGVPRMGEMMEEEGEEKEKPEIVCYWTAELGVDTCL